MKTGRRFSASVGGCYVHYGRFTVPGCFKDDHLIAHVCEIDLLHIHHVHSTVEHGVIIENEIFRVGGGRDNLLNATPFFHLGHARSAMARWVFDFNHSRRHSALGYRTAAAYAAQLTAMLDRLLVMVRSANRPPLRRRNDANLNRRLRFQLDEGRRPEETRYTIASQYSRCPA